VARVVGEGPRVNDQLAMLAMGSVVPEPLGDVGALASVVLVVLRLRVKSQKWPVAMVPQIVRARPRQNFFFDHA